jgi:hypothetical protein
LSVVPACSVVVPTAVVAANRMAWCGALVFVSSMPGCGAAQDERLGRARERVAELEAAAGDRLDSAAVAEVRGPTPEFPAFCSTMLPPEIVAEVPAAVPRSNDASVVEPLPEVGAVSVPPLCT